ncbi:Ski complex subunit Rec14 [Linderina macrospora]|uniref:Ski complex subunit Rec14 n=1 Tax=Linderina macrospora TaxID=4868 RepID=A0ACC1J319_9FUNG|nr:Ski complex subunit Rec14 [Linderina macrospora]
MSSALYSAGALISQAHEDDIWHASWIPGQHRLATAGSDEVVKIWDVQSGECTQQLASSNYAITSLDVNKQGTRMVTSSMDNKMRVWDISTLSSGQVQSTPMLEIDVGAINAWKARFVGETTVYGDDDTASTRSEMIASSTDKGKVRLWSVDKGTLISELSTSRPNFMYALAASPNGALVACAGVGSSVYVFDTVTGSLVSTFAGHSDTVRSVSFSSDSGLLISASDDKQIQVHDVRHGSAVATMLGHTGWVLAAEMHPDGQYIASGSVDTKVKIWDFAQRACVETHSQHSQAVWGVGWQRESDKVAISRPMLASVGEDCSVQIYDPLLA